MDGGAVQAVERTALFGLPNQFLVGASYDHGEVRLHRHSELGYFLPHFVVSTFPNRVFMSGPDDLRLACDRHDEHYVGGYVSNTTDLTRDLS